MHPFIKILSLRGQLETERHYPTRSSKPFLCTHTAKGHNGGVLSVCANDLMFFSASQGIVYYIIYMHAYIYTHVHTYIHIFS